MAAFFLSAQSSLLMGDPLPPEPAAPPGRSSPSYDEASLSLSLRVCGGARRKGLDRSVNGVELADTTPPPPSSLLGVVR